MKTKTIFKAMYAIAIVLIVIGISFRVLGYPGGHLFSIIGFTIGLVPFILSQSNSKRKV